MKNRLSVVLVIAVMLIPQVVSAAWWNPFSWKVFRKPTPIQKEMVEVATSTPTQTTVTTSSKPQPSGLLNNSQRNSQEWLKVIDNYLQDYTGTVSLMEKRIADVKAHNDKHLKNVNQTDESSGAFFLATNLKLIMNVQQMVDALKVRIAELQKIRIALLSTNAVSDSVWNESKNQEMSNFSTNTVSAYKIAVEEWGKNSSDILKFLKTISPQDTPARASIQRDPYVQEQLTYYDKLREARSQIKAELESAGDTSTDSQIYSLALKKLKDAGIKAPVSPYGGYINPNGGYTSVTCNSLGSGFDCYGSDGTRIQSKVIPGSGSFQINAW